LNVIFPMLEIFNIPPLADLVILIYGIGVVYAMVKYQFMGITPALAAENILSTMSDLLVILDLDGRIITANKATTSLLGYKNNEITGKSVNIILGDKKFANELISRSRKEGILDNYNLNLKAKNKKNIPVIFSSSVIKKD